MVLEENLPADIQKLGKWLNIFKLAERRPLSFKLVEILVFDLINKSVKKGQYYKADLWSGLSLWWEL